MKVIEPNESYKTPQVHFSRTGFVRPWIANYFSRCSGLQNLNPPGLNRRGRQIVFNPIELCCPIIGNKINYIRATATHRPW
jgi:hypothetical protein